MGGGQSNSNKKQPQPLSKSKLQKQFINPTGNKLQQLLFKRFQALRRQFPTNSPNTIKTESILQMAQFRIHPLATKVAIQTSQVLGKSTLDFKQFYGLMKVFTDETSYEEKRNFLFGLYSDEQSQKVTVQGLIELFRQFYYDAAPIQDQYIDGIMPLQFFRDTFQSLISRYDQDGDNMLSLEEFSNALGQGDLYYLMNLNIMPI